MTWPLSRAAVEAAARAMAAADLSVGFSFREWDEMPEGHREEYRDRAADILRAALAAWKPSEGQVILAIMHGDQAMAEDASLEDATRVALTTAARTEADE